MKLDYRWLSFAAVGAFLLGSSPCDAQAPEIPNEIQESIRTRVDRGYNVGIVLGVVNPDGVQYFTYGSAALSGDQPLNESTVFEIGSISKVFTSILLADMVERGDVALDDPIQRYLPDSRLGRGSNSQWCVHHVGTPSYADIGPAAHARQLRTGRGISVRSTNTPTTASVCSGISSSGVPV
jgi:CubicO group peptidase (beta-lactamase class C family)